ncbi:hypothetical protein HJFPF1_04764 [Paramyrothecium foliicola]|nr:hypothetical protein HJFPF1_04764 [Paramyrothecium foliicola]
MLRTAFASHHHSSTSPFAAPPRSLRRVQHVARYHVQSLGILVTFGLASAFAAMERKRKLPPRAAARVEQVAKRRHVTPSERSAIPVTPQPVEEPPPPPPPSLPKSIQAGKPLPTVEEAQPDNLSSKEYQSVSESGVLAESLSRSRQKWISEGLFEKYWTKPHKRKGVLTEDPKNPPKDAMSKVGTVTITIEPHILEATMYVVKEPKARPQQQSQASQQPQSQQGQSQAQNRPILQYGPPNGSMPPPPTPTPAVASPTVPASGASNPRAPSPVPASPRPATSSHSVQQDQPSPSPKLSTAADITRNNIPNSPAQVAPPKVPAPVAVSPQAPITTSQILASPNQTTTQSTPVAQVSQPPYEAQPSRPLLTASIQPGTAPLPLARPSATPPIKPAVATTSVAPTPHINGPRPNVAPSPGPPRAVGKPPATVASPLPAAPAAPAAKPAANDPVIALLAQKASGDPELRDLMKRVAVGQAKDGELAHFQKIIDQLNAEYKRKGGQQGPSADRLVVDGRTVKYFADEVRTILDIVLTSNPQQKSTELRPPPRSDPLVVLLVKKALEEPKTRDMIRRIAEGRPSLHDAPDLKEILDRLHKEMKAIPPKPPAPAPAPTPARHPPTPNGLPNGHVKTPVSQGVPNPQALRSKGPPPAPKPDVSAVVFDFGSGDRYLFPKYSILEFLPTNSGQQVVASFLIVRKGSTSEYGGDPTLDYYQPATIRLSIPTGRYLENLARVVAPQDEVRRYMDDVMDNMTRAEYVLLAMQLPRVSKEDLEGSDEQIKPSASTPAAELEVEHVPGTKKPPVLWTTKASAGTSTRSSRAEVRDPEEEAQSRYQKLINSVAARDTESI